MPLKFRLFALLLGVPLLTLLIGAAYLLVQDSQLANRAVAWLAVALPLSALVALALLYAALRRLFLALEAQRQALRRLASGDYTYHLDDCPPHELLSLSQAMNSLGEHLRQARENSRRQIEQTAYDLRESMETIATKNIELDMARRRALQANRSKSEFLANMSHEIRTPLNGIIGFCRLLSRSHLGDRQREWLGHVETASNNLLTLINGILDVSKIEAGKLELESVTLDMVTLVDEVLLLLAPTSQQKGLQLLGLVYDDVPAELLGDPLRIKQVLTNLVHNAIKFTERGDVIVRVLAIDTQDGETTLRVKVSDCGIGLSPEMQKQLFQPFSQGGAERSREYGGTGLGLTICKQLVEQMGGEIGVTSQVGQGATFSFTLPLLSPVASGERSPDVSTPCKPVTRTQPDHAIKRQIEGDDEPIARRVAAQPREGDQPRVLVVDDVASNRLLIGELLAQQGVASLLAESGEQALALASDETVDLVLMDIRMPGMSGVETLRRLRRLGGAWAHCPIVALTAHARKEEARALIDAGMQQVLTKPIDESGLARVLEDYLGLPSSGETHREDELPVVDMALGQAMAGGSSDLARDVLALLLNSLDASEAAIRQAHASGDRDALLDAVHHLNGACRYCGVPQLARLIETLETRLRTQEMGDIDGLLSAVFAAIERLRNRSDERVEPRVAVPILAQSQQPPASS